MNAWSQNDVLPSHFKMHDCSLIDHRNLHVANGTHNQIVLDFVQKRVNSQQFVIPSQQMVARPIDFCPPDPVTCVRNKGKGV